MQLGRDDLPARVVEPFIFRNVHGSRRCFGGFIRLFDVNLIKLRIEHVMLDVLVGRLAPVDFCSRYELPIGTLHIESGLLHPLFVWTFLVL